MFKRNGQEIKNAFTYQPQAETGVEKETLNILHNKQYMNLRGELVDISKQLDYAIEHTKILSPEELDMSAEILNSTDNESPSINTTIEVVNEKTNQAAKRLLDNGKNNIVILNFANGHTPGGGFLGGATAQEETLCKCSGLYECLRNKPKYYCTNIVEYPEYCNHDIIYSPNVPFFRTDDMKLVDQPYLLSVISSPAPNLFRIKNPDYRLIHKLIQQRIEYILLTAHVNNHKNIILGAWGCGAFGNNAQQIANIFKRTIEDMNWFKHVCYAVYDQRVDQTIYNTFKQFAQ